MNQNSWLSMDATWRYLSDLLRLLAEGFTDLTWLRGSTTCKSISHIEKELRVPSRSHIAFKKLEQCALIDHWKLSGQYLK
jgi:hypothetical protein